MKHTVTLPPTVEAPRAARRFLLGELAGDAAREAAGTGAVDDDTLDTALLLATELVTNVVLHAGTSAVLAAERDDHSVTVRVTDRHPAPLLIRPAPGNEPVLREDGRGLALVDALAAAWGTEHTPSGKTVWFRLDTHAPIPDGDYGTGPGDGDGPSPDAGGTNRPPRLLSKELLRVLSAEDEIGELLARLLDAVALRGAQVRRAPENLLPRAVGAPSGQVVIAAAGTPGERDRALAIPLDAPDQRLGELLLWPADATLDSEGRARVALTARWIALALRGADLRRAEERLIGMLSFLAEASDMLAGSLDVDRSLTLLAQLPVPRLATWCTVHLVDPEGTPRLGSCAHADEQKATALAERADDPSGADIARVRGTVGSEGVTTAVTPHGPALLVVLKARHRLLGVLTMGREPGAAFAPDEVELLADLGHRASFAVDNARLFGQQLAVSGALQAGLLPPELPSIAGLELGAAYRPARAGLEVGGDFFDLVPATAGEDGGPPVGGPAVGGPAVGGPAVGGPAVGGRRPGAAGDDGVPARPGTGIWTVTIGDVCGKGAEAAAVTGVARSVLRLLAGQGRDVSDSLLDLNRTLRDAVVPGTPGRFCTAAVVRLDVGDGSGSATGRFALSLRLAGHPPPVRLTAGGEATLVGTPGTLLGILDDAQVAFPETVVELGPGDAMVLYTDGVVEARRGGVMLGDTGLLDVARGCAGLSAQGIADRVRAAADRFSGGAPRDDIAVLVLRVPSVSTGATTRAEDHAGAPSVTLESPWNS